MKLQDDAYHIAFFLPELLARHVESATRRLPEQIHESACFSSCFFFCSRDCPFRKIATSPALHLRGPCGPVIVPEHLDRSNFTIPNYALCILTYRQKAAKPSSYPASTQCGSRCARARLWRQWADGKRSCMAPSSQVVYRWPQDQSTALRRRSWVQKEGSWVMKGERGHRSQKGLGALYKRPVHH